MPTDLRSLVRRGRDLDASIKAAQEELKEIKAALIEAGAGEHEGTDGARALVIFPAAAIKPSEGTVLSLQMKLPKLVFAKLFERILIFKPKKAFREVAEAVLGEKEAGKVIGLCEAESAPQVRFS